MEAVAKKVDGQVVFASDAELMRRVQAGDAASFRTLHDRHARGALHVATLICQDAERARDVVQESFLSMWRHRSQYQDGRGEVQSWVYGIVRNRAIDSRRYHGRHDRHCEASDSPNDNLRASDDLAADLIAREDARHVRLALAALPSEQREVIVLAYFGQLSQVEIALALALPLGTVKGRTRLALAKLQPPGAVRDAA